MKNIFIIALWFWAVLFVPAHAIEVQEVKSNNGLVAWLVQDDSLPLITMQMAWRGGANDETPEEAGISALMAGLLTQGAGAYDEQEFQTRLSTRATSLSFRATRDEIIGTLQCLTPYQAECFELLRYAVAQPHFETAPLTRARTATLAALARAAQDPNQLAAQNLYKTMFRNHRYALPTQGTADSVSRFKRGQIQARHKKIMARDNLVLAIVGNINAQTLRAVMDSVFADLPAHAQNKTNAKAAIPTLAEGIHITRTGPQTSLYFGQKGIARNHPDFFAAYLANHILGGGGFTSRLVEKVRNEQGLAYGTYSVLAPYEQGNLWFGYVASRNETAQYALEIIKAQMADMAAGNITATELANAKAYLTGAYALRFDSGRKIVRELLHTQLDRQPIDYFTTRNQRINAVSLAQVKAAAANLFKPDDLFISSVGQFLTLQNFTPQNREEAP